MSSDLTDTTKFDRKYQTPYHGPHVVLSRPEIERLHEIMEYKFVSPDMARTDDSIRGKLDAALNSHPEFLQPAK